MNLYSKIGVEKCMNITEVKCKCGQLTGLDASPGTIFSCPTCNTNLGVPYIAKCPHCQSEMYKDTKTNRSMILQLLGVIVFVIGFCLLFVFPIGTIVGLLLMCISLNMGYSKSKIMKCRCCGYFFQRS